MSSVVDGEGDEYAMLAAMCRVSPTFRIELIQPLDDHGPYARSLARFGGRDHVHHVRFDVADYDGTRAHLERLGVPVSADEEFAGAPGVESRFRATYFDTEEELGFVLQIGAVPPGFEMPEPDEVYAANASFSPPQQVPDAAPATTSGAPRGTRRTPRGDLLAERRRIHLGGGAHRSEHELSFAERNAAFVNRIPSSDRSRMPGTARRSPPPARLPERLA